MAETWPCSKHLWSLRKPTVCSSSYFQPSSVIKLPSLTGILAFSCCAIFMSVLVCGSSCRRTWRWSRWGWTLWPTWWWWWTRTAGIAPLPPWRANFRWEYTQTDIYAVLLPRPLTHDSGLSPHPTPPTPWLLCLGGLDWVGDAFVFGCCAVIIPCQGDVLLCCSFLLILFTV